MRGPRSTGFSGLILNRESRLSKEATVWFLAEVKHARFWPYHVVDRSSPDPKDPAHVLGIALLINLARFRLLYQEVY